MIRSHFSAKLFWAGVALSLTVATQTGRAQEATQAAKLDTLVEGQKKIISQLDKIHHEVAYLDPLADKKAGVELNPAYLLVGSTDDQLVLSGGFSLFKVDRHAEIAFPIFFRNDRQEDLTALTIDGHYRRFLSAHQNGFYLSGSVRYKYARGREDTDQIPFFDIDEKGPEITLHKFGAGFGIGYRRFSDSNLYWGTSLTVGRYFTGTNKLIAGDHILDWEGYVDVELLKFGIAF
jgi:hypothetical protein